MDRRVRTSVTVQECVQAINHLDGHRSETHSYSAPLILRYKSRKAVDSGAKHVSHPHYRKTTRPPDIATSRSKSVLGVRLEYQDYLLSEYLRSKCALAFSSRDIDNADRPYNVQSEPNIKTTPVYQNYFTDQGKVDTLSVSSGSSNSSSVGTKYKSRYHSSTGRRSGLTMSGSPSGVSSGKVGGPQKNLTGSAGGQTLSFRYTKR